MSPHMKMIATLSFGLLLVIGWHFTTVLGWIGSAPLTQSDFFIRVGVIFFGFFVASGVSAAFLASRNEADLVPDEREEKVELRAERVGVVVMYIGLAIVAWFAFTPMTPMQVANALLAVVWTSELIKLSYALFIYKRRV